MVKQSKLLDKYNLTIEKLDYQYIEQSENAREVEKIFMVLDSNEEGYFPELTELARQRLLVLKPNSKCLRTEEAFLRRSDLEEEKRKEIDFELRNWLNNVKNKEAALTREPNGTDLAHFTTPIRIHEAVLQEIQETKELKKYVGTDYDKWMKFDPDKEEEVEKPCKLIIEPFHKEDQQEKIIPLNISDAQKQELGLYHKTKGNDYFKQGNYEDALQEYTKNISYHPTLASYNNRAIASGYFL